MAYLLSLFNLAFLINGIYTLELYLDNNGPAVRGSKITFTATIKNYGQETVKYEFNDNAQPQHKETFDNSTKKIEWTVEYPRSIYEAGEYTATVSLMRNFVGFWYRDNITTSIFKLTDALNGNLVLSQNNSDRPNHFVAVNQTVTHTVKLPENEFEFLKENASRVVTYWFKDCMYIDQTTDFQLNLTYKDVMVDHYVEALVVADNEPLPPITTTTTTTTTTSTTTTTTTTTATTTTPKPTTTNKPPTTTENSTINLNDSVVAHRIAKRSVTHRTRKKASPPVDFICYNTSIVPIGEKYVYGHYQETLSIRAPISSINITGLNWLQHGDLLHLDVKYAGSPPFDYCIQYKMGQYNITGNETCEIKTRNVANGFPLVHYFSDSDQHTVVVIIENEIDKAVSKATINIYKAKVHAQLSVIVVPVVFCLLAVILVVFGMAYYQHRSRYTIEVADFDFGQAHLDYKTFMERLRDSFRNAFNFRQDDTDPLTTNTRYDSMT